MAITVIFTASNGPQIAKDIFEEKENKNFGAFGAMTGSSTQAMWKSGRAAAFGLGKSPKPGEMGGFLSALGQIG